MVAHMNAQALALTRETGIAHFWSRSRASLWKKGETSGHILNVTEMRIDCDQDAIWVRAEPAGPACHTGQTSCFYRRITPTGLERVTEDAGYRGVIIAAGRLPPRAVPLHQDGKVRVVDKAVSKA